MNKQVLKQMSVCSTILEDVTVDNKNIALVVDDGAGIYVFVNDVEDIVENISLYEKLKSNSGFKNRKLYLLRVYESAEQSGVLYDGNDLYFTDNIYQAYDNCMVVASMFAQLVA